MGTTLSKKYSSHRHRPVSLPAIVFLLLSHCASVHGQRAVPPMPELKALVHATMLDFALAIKAQDFTAFHGNVSKTWQNQVTKEELDDIFRVFWDRNIDLTAIRDRQPEFSQEPTIDDDDLLILKGKYHVPPLAIVFEMSYIWEDQWKLFGINVNAVPASDGSAEELRVPSQEKLVDLTRSTMLDFALAVKGRDFSAFYQKIATIWKQQTTADQLAEIFRSFSEQDIDLTVLKDMTPRFREAPSLNENGVLVLHGVYDTEPSEVTFTLKYLAEAGAWRLAGIKVNVE